MHCMLVVKCPAQKQSGKLSREKERFLFHFSWLDLSSVCGDFYQHNLVTNQFLSFAVYWNLISKVRRFWKEKFIHPQTSYWWYTPVFFCPLCVQWYFLFSNTVLVSEGGLSLLKNLALQHLNASSILSSSDVGTLRLTVFLLCENPPATDPACVL